jgi:hypothetical protein
VSWARSFVLPAAVVGVLVAGCAGPSQPSGGSGAAPHASAPPAPGGSSQSAPRNGLQAASLDLAVGAHQITVRTANLGNDLYRVTTDKPMLLEVSQSQSAVTVRSKPGGDQTGPTGIEIALNRDVRWKLHLNGGSTREDLDTSDGQIQSLTLAAGAYRMDVTLGVPHGEVPVDITGGATDLAFHVPAGTSAALQVVGTVNKVTVDRNDEGRVVGPAGFTVGSGTASDRYQIDCRAGLNTLSLTRG